MGIEKSQAPLMSLRHLRVRLRPRRRWFSPRRGWIEAVNDIHLDIRSGEALAVIGETGSGKSTLGRALAGLVRPAGGSIRYEGQELAAADAKTWRRWRRHIQLIPQAPLADANPKWQLRRILGERLQQLHPELDEATRSARLQAALQRVGLPHDVLDRRAQELSAEPALRAALALAVAVAPQLLICDEPAAGLDEAVRRAILELLAALRQEFGLTLLLLGDDPIAAQRLCSRLVVMYFGQIVEQGPLTAVFERPRHPYTRLLLANVAEGRSAPVPGEPPDPAQPLLGCPFAARCPMADALCSRPPHLQRVGRGHYAACHFVGAAGH
jgi:oligopeptide/dipeptide ABC transporter ATP-binding protein